MDNRLMVDFAQRMARQSFLKGLTYGVFAGMFLTIAILAILFVVSTI